MTARVQTMAGDGNDVRVLVGVPLERNVSDTAFLAFWEIARQGYPLIPRAYCRCDIHRNEMARVLLHSPYTHLVMLDLDHLHPANTVQNLIARVREDPSRKVVANLNFRRSPPYDPCAYWWDADKQQYYTRTEWPPEVLQCDVIGHGAVIIAREVFETIPPPWWAYTYDPKSCAMDADGPWVFSSDDIFFCNRCKEFGVNVYVDPTHTSPHLYQAQITEATYKSHLQQSVASGALSPEASGPAVTID